MSNEKGNTLKPIDIARDKTDEVQRELEVVGAEMHLTHTTLDKKLPESVKRGDVAWALKQNAVMEAKVQDAVDELELVTDLLEEESAQRVRLERKLKAAGIPPG